MVPTGNRPSPGSVSVWTISFHNSRICHCHGWVGGIVSDICCMVVSMWSRTQCTGSVRLVSARTMQLNSSLGNGTIPLCAGKLVRLYARLLAFRLWDTSVCALFCTHPICTVHERLRNGYAVFLGYFYPVVSLSSYLQSIFVILFLPLYLLLNGILPMDFVILAAFPVPNSDQSITLLRIRILF